MRKDGFIMKRFKQFFAMVLSCVLLITPVFSAEAAKAAAAAAPVGGDLSGKTVILHTNDSHSRVSDNMGFAAVSALKKACEAAGAEVMLLDAGDTLHGLPFATVSKGESIVKVMNAVGYDAMTPGNHDFNYGTDRLLELRDEMDFPLLSANVTVRETGEELLDCHTVIEKAGVKYGIFGLSTPETSYKTNPSNVETVEFEDPYRAAEKEVAELQEEGADMIIALAHIGIDGSSEVTSEKIAAQVEGIDLIVDGHSHSTLENGIKVKDTLIVSTGEYINQIGAVVIGENQEMNAYLVHTDEFGDRDAAVEDEIASIQKDIDKMLNVVIGHSDVELNGCREEVRVSETNLGNLAADAIREATGADVVITNGGGIRASIPAGDITKKDLVTVFPFGNYVVTKRMKGIDLLAALEHGVRAYPESLGGFPQVSGVTFTLDASAEPGSRIRDLKINGRPLYKYSYYTVATNDFMAAGGDDYSMIGQYPIENEFSSLEEMLISYIQSNPAPESFAVGRMNVVNASTEQETSETEGTSGMAGTSGTADTSGTTEASGTTESSGAEETPEMAGTQENEGFTIYVVKSGDCLYRIAGTLLGSGEKWKSIYEWNRDVIANPDRIYPDMELVIYE